MNLNTNPDSMGSIATTLYLGEVEAGLNTSQRASIDKLTGAGWTLHVDSHGEMTAIAPYDFASWEIAAAFVRGLGIEGGYSLDWEPEHQWDYDPVSWPLNDPSREEVESRSLLFS